MISTELVNYANFISGELRAMMQPNIQLFQTGKMKSSVFVVEIDEQTIDIIIATPYASFTNERGKMKGWVEETIDRCSRCYCANNGVSNEIGISGAVINVSEV